MKHTGAMWDDRLKIGADREAGTGVGAVHLSFRLGVSCFTRARVKPAPAPSARLSPARPASTTPARLDQYGTRAPGQYGTRALGSVRLLAFSQAISLGKTPKPSLVAKTLTGCQNPHWLP